MLFKNGGFIPGSFVLWGNPRRAVILDHVTFYRNKQFAFPYKLVSNEVIEC